MADSLTSLIFINSLIFMVPQLEARRAGAADVRDGLQLGRSVQAAATGIQRAGHIVAAARLQLVKYMYHG